MLQSIHTTWNGQLTLEMNLVNLVCSAVQTLYTHVNSKADLRVTDAGLVGTQIRGL